MISKLIKLIYKIIILKQPTNSHELSFGQDK